MRNQLVEIWISLLSLAPNGDPHSFFEVWSDQLPPIVPFVKENKGLAFGKFPSFVSSAMEKKSPNPSLECPFVFAPMQNPIPPGMAFHNSGMKGNSSLGRQDTSSLAKSFPNVS